MEENVSGCFFLNTVYKINLKTELQFCYCLCTCDNSWTKLYVYYRLIWLVRVFL